MSTGKKPDWRKAEANRRTRIDAQTPAHIREWLHRIARVHAVLQGVVRVYESPETVGGSSSVHGDTYAARAARGDQTLLYDAIGEAVDQIESIRSDIRAAIEAEQTSGDRLPR